MGNVEGNDLRALDERNGGEDLSSQPMPSDDRIDILLENLWDRILGEEDLDQQKELLEAYQELVLKCS